MQSLQALLQRAAPKQELAREPLPLKAQAQQSRQAVPYYHWQLLHLLHQLRLLQKLLRLPLEQVWASLRAEPCPSPSASAPQRQLHWPQQQSMHLASQQQLQRQPQRISERGRASLGAHQ